MVTHQPSHGRPKSEGGGAERRRWTRVDADLPITITHDGGQSEARVRDVSRAGVCFFLERPLAMMTSYDCAGADVGAEERVAPVHAARSATAMSAGVEGKRVGTRGSRSGRPALRRR